MQEYERWEAFARDMQLVFANGKKLHTEGSQLWHDAHTLANVFRAQPTPHRQSNSEKRRVGGTQKQQQQQQQQQLTTGEAREVSGSKRKRVSDNEIQNEATAQETDAVETQAATPRATSAPSKLKSEMMLDAWMAVRNVVDDNDGRDDDKQLLDTFASVSFIRKLRK